MNKESQPPRFTSEGNESHPDIDLLAISDRAHAVYNEYNRILEKAEEFGEDSLSDDERAFLRAADVNLEEHDNA